ncbi:MAG: phenazine biosynthesis protein PhzC/PhzF family [Ramlibacter sp.]|nr:phenazine biosynthesis protein PhzC/PhzF family [Ramlibacter sp.]
MSLPQARNRAFTQVDVFTATPYRGNALAVVLDGNGLDDAAMQRFARWTNLSETTFLLPPAQADADYRVRIFTPGGELPFAGHPTLGSCHAWLEAGGVPKRNGVVVQECQAGLVQIRREAPRLAFAAPPLKRSAPSPAVLAQVAQALGLKAQQVIAGQVLDNGPVWMTLLLDQPQTVLRLTPDHAALKAIGQKVGVAGIYREAQAGAGTGSPTLEVRAFAAPIGIEEDPVTGSLNASLAQWLIADGHLPAAYVAAQGSCLDRAGRVHIERDAAGQVWVGGESVTCISGKALL